MKKLPILAATCALTLWGCAHSKAEETAANEPPMEEIQNPVTQAREDRMDAPTVYDGEATGGSGTSTTVTTGEGEKWDVQEEPLLGDEPKVPSEKADGAKKSGELEADSEVIDEGPTDDAPQQ